MVCSSFHWEDCGCESVSRWSHCRKQGPNTLGIHHPDMMLIPQSEYEDMEKAHDAAVAECLRFKRSCLKLEGIIKGRIQLQLMLVVKLIRIQLTQKILRSSSS